MDANHCPGAVQFLFRLPCGRRYLHCGDMRFTPSLLSNPHLRRAQGATAVFLDTTYCNPKFTFPPQACVHAPDRLKFRTSMHSDPCGL